VLTRARRNPRRAALRCAALRRAASLHPCASPRPQGDISYLCRFYAQYASTTRLPLHLREDFCGIGARARAGGSRSGMRAGRAHAGWPSG
jgi:hypothetical protein